jgi:protein-histidine pros-kinase
MNTPADPASPHFQALFAAHPAPSLLVDREGRVLLANPAALALFAARDEELVGRLLEALVPARLRSVHRAHRQDFFARLGGADSPGRIDIEAEGLRLDGREFAAEVSIALLPAVGGPFALATVRDVSAQLGVSERLRPMLDVIPDAAIATDPTGRVVIANAMAQSLFGYGPGELEGARVEDLIPERFRDQHVGDRRRFRHQHRARSMGAAGVPLFARRKDGSEVRVEISLNPVATHEGVVVVAAVRDISTRLQYEQERGHRLAAEQAVRTRDELLSIAAHDLKTPLTAASLRLELTARRLKTGPAGEELESKTVSEIIDVQRSLRRLLSKLEQLLDVSRMAEGRFALDRKAVDLGKLVEGVVADLQPEADRSRCVVSLEAQADIQGHWDPLRLEQILANVVSNAIKYGRSGPVSITAWRGEDGWSHVCVADAGPGIPPEEQSRIFDRFERNVGKTGAAGSGLGLWIARQLTAAHGGRLGVDSAVGQGSRFTLSLPPT